MRLLLALSAIIGLLASPVATVAAQTRCDHASGSAMMAGMHTPAMAGIGQSSGPVPASDPCCDQLGHHEIPAKSCAQLCAATCAVAFALPSPPASIVFFSLPAAHGSAPVVSLYLYEPSGLERPPKSIA